MRTAIVNIGTIVSCDWRRPFVAGDAILMEDGRIAAVGTLAANAVERTDVIIDADGTTAIPAVTTTASDYCIWTQVGSWIAMKHGPNGDILVGSTPDWTTCSVS